MAPSNWQSLLLFSQIVATGLASPSPDNGQIDRFPHDDDAHTRHEIPPYYGHPHPTERPYSPWSKPSPSSCSGDSAYPGGGPTATVDCGVIIGTTTSLPAATATVNQYLGVPFAQSPPERFSPPSKPGSCNVNATAWKPACIQQFPYPLAVQQFTKFVFNNPAPQESEDCLYLNVYAPSSPAPADGRAVIFYIYGGSLEFGNAGQHYYDGSWFAGYEDVIVVTSNYRTNVFGFATSPELPITEQNLGYLDQRAALDWVQRNIAAFGGSPEKVTIMGESAGAYSVDAILTSYTADDKLPFRGAIMESGQTGYLAKPYTSSVPSWNQLARLLNCSATGSDLACLRAANASAIKQAIEVNTILFNPVADNVTLVSNPSQRRLSGDMARVPVFAGTNAQEGRVFQVGQNDLDAFLGPLLNNDTAKIQAVKAAYPVGSGSDYDTISQIYTEIQFQCPAALLANASAASGIPTFRYYFNASFPNTQSVASLGVYHASEIPIVWSTYARANVTAQEYALSRTMRSAWAAFVKNPANGPGWNQVGSGVPGDVLVGASSEAAGGFVMGANGTLLQGTYDLGVFGNRGEVLGSGVTVVDSQELDYRCGLFKSIYEANAGIPS